MSHLSNLETKASHIDLGFDDYVDKVYGKTGQLIYRKTSTMINSKELLVLKLRREHFY